MSVIARRHLEDLGPAVGIEGDERQRRLRAAVRRPLLAQPHDQFAAGVAGRQRHHQGRDHVVGLLRVLVGKEELVRLIDQEGMKIGGQAGGVREA